MLKEAQHAIKAENRSSALRALRSRKLAEVSLDQKTESLMHVELIYSKIEQAADQAAIIQIMKASTGVLRSLHARTGGVQKVEDAVEEMRNEIAKVDQISNIINEAGQESDHIDEDALNEELETLMNVDIAKRNEERSREVRERVLQVNVPANMNEANTSEEPVTPQTTEKTLTKLIEYEDPLVTQGIRDIRQLSLE